MNRDLPILLLPRPTEASSLSKGSRPPSLHLPTGSRQAERLAPAFEELGRAIAKEEPSLQASAYATAPECVVVFQTAGSVDGFLAAVKATGLDWLGEFDEADVPPDDDFFHTDDRSAPVDGRLYLVMANQKAIEQLLSLWKRFREDGTLPFPTGSTTLKTVFKQLRAVRRWDMSDRLHETRVLETWRADLRHRQDVIRFEAELFYRKDDIKRGKAKRSVEISVQSYGGQVISETVLGEIGYHGLLLELPAKAVAHVLEAVERRDMHGLKLLQAEDVMFFRPGPQHVGITPLKSGEVGTHQPTSLPPRPSGKPILALLDGLPLANHPLLADRLIVDDPDGFEANYAAQQRQHGTAMASLMIYDELGSGQPVLSNPVYVRPIMRPDERTGGVGTECMPHGKLPVDIIYRAVRGMMLGEGDGPAAPSVKVVGLSLGDQSRQFDGLISPMARLLDWLAFKHKLLFVVSAGNHAHDINLGVPKIGQMQDGELQATVLKAVAGDVRHRKLLAPAESINALTVGAAHADRSTFRRVSRRHDPYSDKLPCPYSAVGLGFRRGIKPDVLLPGGRQLLIEPLMRKNGSVVLETANFAVEPGQQVAAPHGTSPSTPATCFTRGTSNATALAARHAARICEMLARLDRLRSDNQIEERFYALIAKALLVHGARWGDTYHTMKRILSPNSDSDALHDQIARSIGYGLADPDRVMACTERRATMIGSGLIKDGEAKVFEVPLPDSLSGKREWRRLAITLAWFSPIAPAHRNYRKAKLWFNDPSDPLKLGRQDVHWQAAQRGTVQHEIFEGEAASAFAEKSSLKIQVNCREDAAKLDEHVSFALAVTLEVAEGSSVPVYGQMRARVEPKVTVRSVG